MGYRSDVVMYIEGKAVPAVLAAMRMDPAYAGQYMDRLDEVVVNESGLYLAFSDIKWYDDYEDVAWFNRLYALAEEMYDEDHSIDLHGMFLRIGEEADDVVELFFGDNIDWDTAAIRRTIEVNGPFEWR